MKTLEEQLTDLDPDWDSHFHGNVDAAARFYGLPTDEPPMCEPFEGYAEE